MTYETELISDDKDRQLSVERAIKVCANSPRAEWGTLIKNMATPGFAVALGKMLRISDEMDEAEAKEQRR